MFLQKVIVVVAQGLGKISCTTCGGKGTTSTTTNCTTCSGKGTVSKVVNCTTCSGTGTTSSTITCSTCSGSGTRTGRTSCSHSKTSSHYYCSHGTSYSSSTHS